jgi:short-subunit dehydrogenase involved in D-alanine esterification of teichoic acids
MKNIVITRSTSCVGFGPADSFLSLGCSVAISGRSQVNLEKAHNLLVSKHKPSRLVAHSCDTTYHDQVQALWDTTKVQFDEVDI